MVGAARSVVPTTYNLATANTPWRIESSAIVTVTGGRLVPASRSEWTLEPIEGNPGPARVATPPGYETDPYEMSVEELQRLLDAACRGGSPRASRRSWTEQRG